ncbi:transposase, partial [Patescibacteria group bacterium]|nr:transposase [Patescibacteria group bacterium]
MTQRRIYQNEYPYFITFRTQEGCPLFEETKHAKLLSKIIFRTGQMKRFGILSYQIMPDHVHILTMSAGRDTRARGGNNPLPTRVSVPAVGGNQNTISDFIYTLKSYFYNQIRSQYNVDFPFWQKRYYTRIVNTDKYLYTVIKYIKQNPIEAELPDKYH